MSINSWATQFSCRVRRGINCSVLYHPTPRETKFMWTSWYKNTGNNKVHLSVQEHIINGHKNEFPWRRRSLAVRSFCKNIIILTSLMRNLIHTHPTLPLVICSSAHAHVKKLRALSLCGLWSALVSRNISRLLSNDTVTKYLSTSRHHTKI